MIDRQGSIRNILGRLNKGFKEELGRGKEDYRQALRRGYASKGQDTEQTMVQQMFGSNRTATLMRELAGKADKDQVASRNDMNLGLSNDKWERRGQIAGTLVSDVVQDRGRAIWWLFNAPQALGNVVNDVALKMGAPNLFKSKRVTDKAGREIQYGALKNMDEVRKAELIADRIIGPDTLQPTAGVSIDKEGYLQQRVHKPGHVDLLAIPAGFAINTSVGLMNPFGGSDGYKAVVPNEDDPTKTSNILGEVGAKYILGRTGNLLAWDDFKEVRPDVSKDEYMRYKALKFDNEMDLNPFDDGKAVAPGGIAKYTNEGIHGPEIQFLGKSLPLATGIMPTAAAIAGTAYGARRGGVRGGLKAGAASTAGAMLLGNIIEGERRRRNKAENERDTIEQ